MTANMRKQALDWLKTEGVLHLVLFQQVKVHDRLDAQRFQHWLGVQAAGLTA